MINNKIDLSNTIDENYNINYIKLLFIVCTHPKFISNITNILIIICFIFNLDKLLHILMPLCLTNGIIIMIMMLIIKNINVSSNIFIFKDKKHKQIINNLLQKYTYSVIIFQFVIHFIYIFILYYIGKLSERKTHSFFLQSFFINIFIISLYAYNFNINTYSSVSINVNNIYYVLPIYLLCNLIISYIYFI